MKETIKILFISRAYPPILGGIENQNYGIATALKNISEISILANKCGKKYLPFFLPWAFIRASLIFRRFDAVLLGDGVLAPLGAWLKLIFPKKKAVSIVHGLDITFGRKKSFLGKIYRLINIPSLRKLDRLIMVGHETIREAAKLGISQEKCVFIPNGIFAEKFTQDHSRLELEKILGIGLAGKKVIFRGGRFVKHKGLEWFIRNIMPALPENYLLVAAGGAVSKATPGDENNLPNCKKAVKELGFENRIFLIPNIPQPDLEIIFSACDLYVSPNIKIPGSMEGFGITAIEAGACGRVVLASNIEGLKDAIIDGENGFLVETGNKEAWIKKIKEVLENDTFRQEFGEKAQKYVTEHFSWEIISKRYLEEIEKVAANNQ